MCPTKSWVRGQHAERCLDRWPFYWGEWTKSLLCASNSSPWNTREKETYGHFSWVLETFRSRYKALYKIYKGIGRENRAIYPCAHQSWGMDDSCYWALCAPVPKPGLVGNNCGPLFNATNKPLKVCNSSLGLCCDFFWAQVFPNAFSKMYSSDLISLRVLKPKLHKDKHMSWEWLVTHLRRRLHPWCSGMGRLWPVVVRAPIFSRNWLPQFFH